MQQTQDLLTKLRKSEEGVTAVEFALVAPMLLLIMMGIIETGLIMFTQNVMEGATFSASRLGKTGYTESGETREDLIIQQLTRRAGTLINASEIEINAVTYAQFDQIGDPEPFIDANHNGTRDSGENYTDSNGNGHYDEDMGIEGLGNAGEVVVYTVSYPWHIYTPMMSRFFGSDGTIDLTARTVVQNEPYNEDD